MNPALMRFASGMAGMLLSGCALAPESVQTRFFDIKDYHLRDAPTWQDEEAGDPMVPFERKRLLYGAVTEADRRERAGHYYSFRWADESAAGAATFRFEYRQTGTGDEVHRMERTYPQTKSRNRTRVEVVGEPYHAQGRIVAWRASLWRQGVELASTQSFLW